MMNYDRVVIVGAMLWSLLLLAGCGSGSVQSQQVFPTPVPTTPTATGEPTATMGLPIAKTETPTHTPTQEEQPMDSTDITTGTATVEAIAVRIAESFPVQVFVDVQGFLADGCTSLDQIEQQRQGTTYTVTLTTRRPTEAMCTMALKPFEKTVALDVAGMPAGVYTVSVHGITETFRLEQDNRLNP